MNSLNVRNSLLGFGLALVGAGAMAQTATINFSGNVSAQTCVITASLSSGYTLSTSSLTVNLPTVASGQLTSGATLGKVKFYMGVYGCTAAAAGVNYTPKLYLSSTSASSGYLSTSLTNLVLELLDESGNTISLSTTPTAFTNSSFSFTGSASTSAEKAYSIQYRANGGAVTATGSIGTIAMNVVLQYS